MDIRIRRSNTILYCSKWSETVSFYRERIGLVPVMSRDWFVEFQLNREATLSVADQERATIKSAGGGGVTVSFLVDDAETIRNRLDTDDVAPKPGPMRSIWGSQAFYIHDPEGNRLEFWS